MNLAMYNLSRIELCRLHYKALPKLTYASNFIHMHKDSVLILKKDSRAKVGNFVWRFNGTTYTDVCPPLFSNYRLCPML